MGLNGGHSVAHEVWCSCSGLHQQPRPAVLFVSAEAAGRRLGNATSGNYKAFRDRDTGVPSLYLFNNRIAWLDDCAGGDYDYTIRWTDAGFPTRTTHRTLNQIAWSTRSIQHASSQWGLFQD